MWCLGFFFETVGDCQLSRFRGDPARRGQVLDTGLWRYTRHPNYFGELCQWWGLFVIALEAPWAWCGVIGPLVYSWLVINVTGQRTLDKKLSREKPGYAEYMHRTSGLLPRPPRRD
jgi:steroid 5-alpha reductase family enzyme